MNPAWSGRFKKTNIEAAWKEWASSEQSAIRCFTRKINSLYEKNSRGRAGRLAAYFMSKRPGYKIIQENDGSYSVVRCGINCDTATIKDGGKSAAQAEGDGKQEAPHATESHRPGGSLTTLSPYSHSN